MPIDFTPSAEYAVFPIKLPYNGDSTDAKNVGVTETAPKFNINNVFGDTLNRIVYLKETQDDILLSITSLGEKDVELEESITNLSDSLASTNTVLAALSSMVGGTEYLTSYNYISSGQNHNVCLQELDAQVKINTTNVGALQTLTSTQSTNITSLAGKLSTNALDNNVGFTFTGLTLLATGDKTDEAFRKLEPAILANRRINHQNFINIFNDWRDFNTVLALDTFYDDLIDNSKIYATLSTAGAYDNLRQSFGTSTGTWAYYCIAKNITLGSDEIKIRLNKNSVGTLVVSASLSGAYDGTFVTITDENTWTDISSSGTTDYVILKVVGSGGALLYSISALLR